MRLLRRGDLQGGWLSGTLPGRQPEGEIRALATLVDAIHHAAADVGSIPTVSTEHRLQDQSPGADTDEVTHFDLVLAYNRFTHYDSTRIVVVAVAATVVGLIWDRLTGR